MHYKKLTPQKIRSRLVRKGFFTQLPIESNKPAEGAMRLFRTIIDHALFAATSDDLQERKDAFKWINPKITYSIKGLDEYDNPCSVNNVQDFNMACSIAGLNPEKTRVMILNCLENFFPHVFLETSCSFRL